MKILISSPFALVEVEEASANDLDAIPNKPSQNRSPNELNHDRHLKHVAGLGITVAPGLQSSYFG